MSETECIANASCPLPRGEGGPRPALSPVGAGRVRGQCTAERDQTGFGLSHRVSGERLVVGNSREEVYSVSQT